eukprot:scaffold65981_cov25-Tisochrysis_lutea.AAC.1
MAVKVHRAGSRQAYALALRSPGASTMQQGIEMYKSLDLRSRNLYVPSVPQLPQQLRSSDHHNLSDSVLTPTASSISTSFSPSPSAMTVDGSTFMCFSSHSTPVPFEAPSGRTYTQTSTRCGTGVSEAIRQGPSMLKVACTSSVLFAGSGSGTFATLFAKSEPQVQLQNMSSHKQNTEIVVLQLTSKACDVCKTCNNKQQHPHLEHAWDCRRCRCSALKALLHHGPQRVNPEREARKRSTFLL